MPFAVKGRLSSTINAGTSSGDTTFGIEDYWVVSDDDNGSNPYPNSRPTVAHVVEGPGASTPLLLASRVSGTLSYRWDNVTVPAGGGGVFDVEIDKPGLYPFVSHAFAAVDEGQVGLLKVGDVQGTMSH